VLFAIVNRLIEFVRTLVITYNTCIVYKVYIYRLWLALPDVCHGVIAWI